MSKNCLPQVLGINEGGTGGATSTAARGSLGFNRFPIVSGTGTILSGQPSVTVVQAVVITGDIIMITSTGTSINTKPLTLVSISNLASFVVGTHDASNATADYLFSYIIFRTT